MVPGLDFKVETLKGTGKRVHKKDTSSLFSLISVLCSLFSVAMSKTKGKMGEGRFQTMVI